MKRKLFTSLFPVLMALTACGGAGPKNPGPELFKEDTLAHEEIFGDINSGLSRKVTRNLDPLDPATAEPLIGIQAYTETEGYVSLRFVAAVHIEDGNLGSTTAVWNRAMFTDEGDVFKVAENMPSTKAYTSIKDNGADLTADAFDALHGDTGYYTHFVVYSMLNIPFTYNDTDIREYYLTATLTLSGATYTYTAATNVNRTKQVSFKPAIAGEYSLRGKINNVDGVTQSHDNNYGDNPLPQGKVARFTTTLKSADTFYVVYNHVDATPADSKFHIYPVSEMTLNNLFTESGNKINPKADGNYVLYVSNENKIEVKSPYTLTYTNKSSQTVTLPLTCAGWDKSSNLQYKAVFSPATDSTLTVKEGDSAKTLTYSEGNVTESYTIFSGGDDLDIYFFDYTTTEGTGWGTWGEYPECSVKVNGTLSPVKSRTGLTGDIAVFDISLEAGDKAITYCGEKALTLEESSDTEYTAPDTTNYIIYVNYQAKVYVTELVEVTISGLEYGTDYGQSLYVVGSFFGTNWAPLAEYKLDNVDNIWSGSFWLPVDAEFKLRVANTDNPAAGDSGAWESGSNRVVEFGMDTITAWKLS